MFQEFPKWVYPAGVKESFAEGEAPFVVQDADEEAALTTEPPEAPARRGRPPKVAE